MIEVNKDVKYVIKFPNHPDHKGVDHYASAFERYTANIEKAFRFELELNARICLRNIESQHVVVRPDNCLPGVVCEVREKISYELKELRE